MPQILTPLHPQQFKIKQISCSEGNLAMTQFLLEQVGTEQNRTPDKTESNGLTCIIHNVQTPTDINGTMSRLKCSIYETGSTDPQEGSEWGPAAGLRRPCK